MKVLILGGYGVFGGRLAELLANIEALEILVAGRSLSKAQKFCEKHQGSAHMRAIQADRREIDGVLASCAPTLLVDASGPFQEYGDSRYSVVEACIRHKISYLDLADASGFVGGISEFDHAAKQAGVFVLSGVSSFPVLTVAVLRELETRLQFRTVVGGIAPSPFAGVGENVLRAVLGYAGKPVSLVRHGAAATGIGLVESMRYTVAPPGKLPLRNLRYSLVDVPDLELVPKHFRSVTDIWVGAGPVPEFLHRFLSALAWLKWKLHLPSLKYFADIAHWVINTIRYGEHRGGMFIEVSDGEQNGKSISWHLLAEGDDGPYIPSMAAEIIIRKVLRGQYPQPGARSGATAMTLQDYEAVFEGRQIYSGIREAGPLSQPIFREVLGKQFRLLPKSIQTLHQGDGSSDWRGEVTTSGSNTARGRLIARLFGFPTRSGIQVATVAITRTKNGESWLRTFGDKRFRSELSQGHGRDEWLICERFGLVTISIALVWKNNKLWYVPRRWRLGPIPLPWFLMPKGNTCEYEEDGMFWFDVTIEAPVVGHIASYKGYLRPNSSSL